MKFSQKLQLFCRDFYLIHNTYLRIDNCDFHVISLVFTVFLIFLRLHDISDVMIHQMKAEILSYRMIIMV